VGLNTDFGPAEDSRLIASLGASSKCRFTTLTTTRAQEFGYPSRSFARQASNATIIGSNREEVAMRKGNKLPQLSIAGSILALMCSSPAAALTITIDDTTDNVVITSDSANTHVSGGPEASSFQITDPLLNNPGTGVAAVLVEPPGGLTGFQILSDGISVDPTTFALSFESDTDGVTFTAVNCSLPAVFDCIAETGSPVDVGPIVYGASSGISIIVTSDLDPVPEPSGLAILASALAGMVGLTWRRRARIDRWD
jgi:hypothetical protein